MTDSPQDSREIDLSQPLTIADALHLAMGLHRADHHDEAQEVYTRILTVAPEHPDALHFMGVLAHDQGRDEDALRLMMRSVELVPDHAGFRSNLGNLLLDAERFEDAERQYRQALEIDPDRPDVLHNYAVLCKALCRYEEAERCLLRAIELAPDLPQTRHSLGALFINLGRYGEAMEQAFEGLIREPRNARTRELLADVQCRLGRPAEAAQLYREWLAEEPDNPRVRHHLAACSGQDIPARASDAYVQSVFDSFAESFDSRLASLEYRAPALVVETVAACLGEPAANLAILDAGCGTGLCAALLKPFAATLTGIDLSQGMLAKAAGRKLYDALHQAELCAYMRAHPLAHDLIVSADTLVYFGDLEEAMGAAAGALRPGGYLCFTVEAQVDGETGDYLLRHHGRYAHSRDYLAALLRQAGLSERRLDAVVLRREAGWPVAGWLVLAQQPGFSVSAG